MRQTAAIFLDAYRELNSKKLFWIVMALSLLVVLVFAMIGIDEKGMTFLWFSFPTPFNSTIFPPPLFYKLAFANFGVKFWLAWISTILALVATAGIIPDLIASGSIELTLSKPISRARLFLTKFASGLAFTTIQVGLFTAAIFFVLGFRANTWEPGLFWTVPIMVVFYSYLFSICVLLGVVTRSTVASLLITLLIWFVAIFGVHTGERTLLLFRERNASQLEKLQAEVDALKKKTAAQTSEPTTVGQIDLSKIVGSDAKKLERKEQQLHNLQDSKRTIGMWHTGLFSIKSVLPKTTETLDLLERVLISQADMMQLRGDDTDAVEMNFSDAPDEPKVNMKAVTERMQDRIRSRSVWWVVGTSLAFEGVVLGIAVWIFARRDF